MISRGRIEWTKEKLRFANKAKDDPEVDPSERWWALQYAKDVSVLLEDYLIRRDTESGEEGE